MSSEYLEAFERLNEDDSDYALKRAIKDIEIVGEALQRLEAIDNATPSKALELFEEFKDILLKNVLFLDTDLQELNGIKRYILKSQEQEKENARYKQLEEQLGCPLEVRCKVVCDSSIYDENDIEYKVTYIYKEYFDCEDPFDNDMGYTKLCAFEWKDYKKTWWLKENREE